MSSEFTVADSGRTYTMPPAIRRGLDGYVLSGQAGGFIMAALKNDFADALGRADIETAKHLKDINWYIQNELPGYCHGSPEAVKAYGEEIKNREEA